MPPAPAARMAALQKPPRSPISTIRSPRRPRSRKRTRNWIASWTSVIATGYRIERTREGRDHEIIGETGQLLFFVINIPLDEPWFYRVKAFNLRGDGGFRLVWLFRQSSSGKFLLISIAAMPGLHVSFWE